MQWCGYAWLLRRGRPMVMNVYCVPVLRCSLKRFRGGVLVIPLKFQGMHFKVPFLRCSEFPSKILHRPVLRHCLMCFTCYRYFVLPRLGKMARFYFVLLMGSHGRIIQDRANKPLGLICFMHGLVLVNLFCPMPLI